MIPPTIRQALRQPLFDVDGLPGPSCAGGRPPGAHRAAAGAQRQPGCCGGRSAPLAAGRLLWRRLRGASLRRALSAGAGGGELPTMPHAGAALRHRTAGWTAAARRSLPTGPGGPAVGSRGGSPGRLKSGPSPVCRFPGVSLAMRTLLVDVVARILVVGPRSCSADRCAEPRGRGSGKSWPRYNPRPVAG